MRKKWRPDNQPRSRPIIFFGGEYVCQKQAVGTKKLNPRKGGLNRNHLATKFYLMPSWVLSHSGVKGGLVHTLASNEFWHQD